MEQNHHPKTVTSKEYMICHPSTPNNTSSCWKIIELHDRNDVYTTYMFLREHVTRQTVAFLRKRTLRNQIKIGLMMKDHSYIIYFSINRGSQSMGSLHEKWGCNVQTSFTRHPIHKQRRLRFKIWRGKNSPQTSRYDAKLQLNKHDKWKQLT